MKKVMLNLPNEAKQNSTIWGERMRPTPAGDDVGEFEDVLERFMALVASLAVHHPLGIVEGVLSKRN